MRKNSFVKIIPKKTLNDVCKRKHTVIGKKDDTAEIFTSMPLSDLVKLGDLYYNKLIATQKLEGYKYINITDSNNWIVVLNIANGVILSNVYNDKNDEVDIKVYHIEELDNHYIVSDKKIERLMSSILEYKAGNGNKVMLDRYNDTISLFVNDKLVATGKLRVDGDLKPVANIDWYSSRFYGSDIKSYINGFDGYKNLKVNI